MTDPTHIGWHWFIGPTFSAKKKPLVMSKLCCAQEEFLHASFAIGKTIAEERDIAGKARVVRYWIMGFGIESVVDVIVGARSCVHVTFFGFWTAAVGKDRIVAGNSGAKGITLVSMNAAQRCGGIHVPEDDCAIWLQLQNAAFEEIVINTEPAVLNDNVCFGCQVEHRVDVYRRSINEGIYIGEVVIVVMLLTSKGIGRGESNLKSSARQILVNSTVIGCGSVPVGGEYAGAKSKYLHESDSWRMVESC